MEKAIFLLDISFREAREKDIFSVLNLLDFKRIGSWFNEVNQRSYLTYASIKALEDEKALKELLAEKLDDFTLRVVPIDEFDDY